MENIEPKTWWIIAAACFVIGISLLAWMVSNFNNDDDKDKTI